MNRFAQFVLPVALIGCPAVAAPGAEPPAHVPPDNAALQYWQASASISAETLKRLEDFDTLALQGDAVEDVRDDNPSIALVHAGAAMSKCDWGLDLRKGPEMLMPHLNKTRVLGRETLMRARYRFEQGRWHDGLTDVLATFEMAKDTGDTPVMISVLVRYNIEQLAIATLERHLDKMDRSTLDELAKALDTIPAPDRFKDVFPTESKYFIDWALDRLAKIDKASGGDAAKWSKDILSAHIFSPADIEELQRSGVPSPAELRATVESVRGVLAEEEQIVDRPLAEQDAWLAEARDKRFGSKPMLRLFVTTQERVFAKRREWQARHALLKAAVAVRRDGESALKDKKYADPFGDAPFTFRKTDGGGFELQSKLVVDGKPVTLIVGKPK